METSTIANAFPFQSSANYPNFGIGRASKRKLCCPNFGSYGIVIEVSVFRSFLGVDRNSLETGREILHPRTVLVEIVQAKLGARAEVDTL
jgi:hypothetical protein